MLLVMRRDQQSSQWIIGTSIIPNKGRFCWFNVSLKIACLDADTAILYDPGTKSEFAFYELRRTVPQCNDYAGWEQHASTQKNT
jgi:hypothetical protein